MPDFGSNGADPSNRARPDFPLSHSLSLAWLDASQPKRPSRHVHPTATEIVMNSTGADSYVRETSPVPSGCRAIVQHSDIVPATGDDLAEDEAVRPLR
jgi:hypothetical protein